MERNPLDRLPQGLKDRTLVTAKLASKVGMSYLKKQLNRKNSTTNGEVSDEAVREFEKLVDQLGSLKGVLMKFGQMASYLPGSLPPKVQQIFSQLQADSQPLAFDAVSNVVRGDFAKSPGQLFESFEEKPFASASVGQVHRARFAGRDVAVKVQYPDMKRILESDLKTFGTIMRAALFPTAMDSKSVVAELRDRILEECDYSREATNQRLFKRLLANDPNAYVPEVIDDASGPHVLTTEFIRQKNFADFRSTAPQEAKDKAGTTIFRACFMSIFNHCVFNADPHPGNYLFGDDGRVTFLDFGCIRYFEPRMIDGWKRLARTVMSDDRVKFVDAYRALGLVPKPDKFDFDYEWDIMRYVYRPYTQKEPFTYTDEYIRESYALMVFKNPNRMRTSMPAEWLFVNRLQWGLNAILAHLKATGPWQELWRAAIESETKPASIN